ncbi:MAG: GntR family transcriptional regulator [Nocardioidaceae bacterium]
MSRTGLQAFIEPEADDRLPQRIADQLKAAILQGHIKPGERLNEIELAEAVGTSRTPVREAIRTLEASGLVVVTPRRGARVIEVTPESMAHNYLCRAQLYGLAASVATLRRSPQDVRDLTAISRQIKAKGTASDHLSYLNALVEFGDRLVEISRVPQLHDLLELLKGPSLLVRFKAASSPGRTQAVHARYRAVVDAVRTGDSRAAQHEMSLAILESGRWLLSQEYAGTDPQQLSELETLLSVP